MGLWPQILSADWVTAPEQNMPVCTAQEAQNFPEIAPDSHGGVIIAWNDARNENQDIFAQRVSAKGEMLWGKDGIPICDLPSPQGWSIVLTDENGGAIIIFRDLRHGNPDIYAQRVDANGRLLWDKEGIPVCTDPSLQDDVKAIPDSEGGAILAWEDWRNGNQDIYAQRIDGNGKPVWTPNGVPVYRGDDDQYDPFLATDGAGGQSLFGGTLARLTGTFSLNDSTRRDNRSGEIRESLYVLPPAIKAARSWLPTVRAGRFLSGQTIGTIRTSTPAQTSTPKESMRVGKSCGKRMESASVITRPINNKPKESAMAQEV